jgi:hypothetical protein
MSDMFPIKNCLKQELALLPLLFNFSLAYAIRKVQANQEGLKSNRTHHLSLYADYGHTLGGYIHTIKKNTEALAVTSKDNSLQVSAKKIKYMAKS